MTTRRFWLFGGSVHYPEGGMKDFHRSYHVLSDARSAAIAEGWDQEYKWYEIYDLEESKVIERKEEGKDDEA